MLTDVLDQCHILVPAAHWLAGEDAAQILAALRPEVEGTPKVGLFGWLNRSLVEVWVGAVEPEPGKEYLLSTAVLSFLGDRWPGVDFVLLPDDAPEEYARRVHERIWGKEPVGNEPTGIYNCTPKDAVMQFTGDPLDGLYRVYAEGKSILAAQRRFFALAAGVPPADQADAPHVVGPG